MHSSIGSSLAATSIFTCNFHVKVALEMAEKTTNRLRVDAVLGNTVIELKSGVNAVRSLRAGLINLAYALVEKYPQKKGLLVLTDPKITEGRLEGEWNRAWQALQPEVMNRLGLVVFKDGDFRGLPQDPDPEIRRGLRRLISRDLGAKRIGRSRGEIYYDILRILIHQWMLSKGPVHAAWLGEIAGCSYPTVAAALRRLGRSIKRHSDRRIELRHFPRDEWAKLLAVSDRVRSTMRFSDQSGQPRSPDSLLRRLGQLGRHDIGVGGVFGARHHYPDLDLVGTPRLDLSIHSPNGTIDSSLIDNLDPALKQLQDSHEPASLAVHILYRKKSLFESASDGVEWADPVECLLDLLEAHLEPQASELLYHFVSRRANAR